jgi:hypothetical protein
MAKIVVVMEGGLLQCVLSTEPVEIAVIDYDTEGADLEGIKPIPQSDGKFADAYVRIEGAEINLERVEELFTAVR